MKAIGRNLIIQAIKQGVSETKGGLLLAEKQREDIRYEEATVISAGNEVVGIKKNDVIYYDRNAGHDMLLGEESVSIIQERDVVVVL